MLENKNSRTELSALGEFGLIHELSKHVTIKNQSTLKGIGDDCAVLDHGGKKLLLTTDMLLEGIHFDLAYVPLKHLGYKAIAVNVSDICAMNGTPAQVLVALGISNRFSLEAVEELYSGMLLACEKYGVDLAGGDTSASRSGLTIAVTAIGTGEEGKIVYRSGACETDLICVTGDLGGAYMGLQLLEREKSVFLDNPKVQPDLDGNDYILERQLKPEARTDMITLFRERGILPTSMIDISDGLASELLHLCHASGKGCQVYEEKFPLDHLTSERAKEFGLDPTLCALSGGEDYELLFTLPLKQFDFIKNDPNITVIGHVTSQESGCNMVTRGGSLAEITAQGWDAFLRK
ncbi:MAG: thiamine-phosphate kinase [Bacteroidia bacterium]|nr:thiamine-phosphate kinase [Bacteroidia bacterium]